MKTKTVRYKDPSPAQLRTLAQFQESEIVKVSEVVIDYIQ